MSDEGVTRKDSLSQMLLLGPGVAMTTVGLISVLRHSTAVIAWIVLAFGVVLLLTYRRARLRGRIR